MECSFWTLNSFLTLRCRCDIFWNFPQCIFIAEFKMIFSILKKKFFYQDEHKNKCSNIRWHSCTFQAIWHMLYCRTVFLLLLSKTAIVILKNVFVLFFLFRQQGTRDGSRIFVALFDYDPPTMSPNPEACDEELPFREGQLIKVSKKHNILIYNLHFYFLTWIPTDYNGTLY